jgi:hypothetical protein
VKANILLGLVLTSSLTACATRPESIPASYVSHEKYAGLTCEELTERMEDARQNLQKASDKQNARGYFKQVMGAAMQLGGLDSETAGRLSGDSAEDVAKWKGEGAAIDLAKLRASCKLPG